jgi:hypothetical protein
LAVAAKRNATHDSKFIIRLVRRPGGSGRIRMVSILAVIHRWQTLSMGRQRTDVEILDTWRQLD